MNTYRVENLTFRGVEIAVMRIGQLVLFSRPAIEELYNNLSLSSIRASKLLDSFNYGRGKLIRLPNSSSGNPRVWLSLSAVRQATSMMMMSDVSKWLSGFDGPADIPDELYAPRAPPTHSTENDPQPLSTPPSSDKVTQPLDNAPEQPRIQTPPEQTESRFSPESRDSGDELDVELEDSRVCESVSNSSIRWKKQVLDYEQRLLNFQGQELHVCRFRQHPKVWFIWRQEFARILSKFTPSASSLQSALSHEVDGGWRFTFHHEITKQLGVQPNAICFSVEASLAASEKFADEQLTNWLRGRIPPPYEEPTPDFYAVCHSHIQNVRRNWREYRQKKKVASADESEGEQDNSEAETEATASKLPSTGKRRSSRLAKEGPAEEEPPVRRLKTSEPTRAEQSLCKFSIPFCGSSHSRLLQRLRRRGILNLRMSTALSGLSSSSSSSGKNTSQPTR
jgi:hypothetical protein